MASSSSTRATQLVEMLKTVVEIKRLDAEGEDLIWTSQIPRPAKGRIPVSFIQGFVAMPGRPRSQSVSPGQSFSL